MVVQCFPLQHCEYTSLYLFSFSLQKYVYLRLLANVFLAETCPTETERYTRTEIFFLIFRTFVMKRVFVTETMVPSIFADTLFLFY